MRLAPLSQPLLADARRNEPCTPVATAIAVAVPVVAGEAGPTPSALRAPEGRLTDWRFRLALVLGVLLLLHTTRRAIVSADEAQAVPPQSPPLRILFIGNSFTYGPPPFDREDKLQLNNLPRFFKLVAESLGHGVQQMEDTIGGCTLFMHMPSSNAEGCDADCALVDLPRVNGSEQCTVAAAIPKETLAPQYAPCPQLLMRQPFGPWDVVVVQEQSIVPAVRETRAIYTMPAVAQISEAYRRSAADAREQKPVVAAYMTWPYYNGSGGKCPDADRPGCFPLGNMSTLAGCGIADSLASTLASPACQAYALARGYASTLDHGADVLVPAGLAWLAARGAPPIAKACRDAIDAEYEGERDYLADISLPIRVRNPEDARWDTLLAARSLYNYLGPNSNSTYCTDGCDRDHHPSALSQYLNACVFFATLFGKSPIGAAFPDGEKVVDGMTLPALLTQDDVAAATAVEARAGAGAAPPSGESASAAMASAAAAMQRIAHDVVFRGGDGDRVWWRGQRRPATAPHARMPYELV